MFLSLPQATAAVLGLIQISHAAQSTVTIRIATGTCPALGPFQSLSETVMQYSTADSAGSYFLTSTTEALSASFYTHTTTDSAGNTVVIPGSTLITEPLGPSTTLGSLPPVTSTYLTTTTNSAGSVIVSSETTEITPTSPASPVTTYTMTNPAGSLVTTTSTKSSASSPGVITSTEPSTGSSVTAGSTTSTGSPAASSSTAAQATGRTPCPAPLAESYTASDGSVWQLVCNSNIYYDDLPATNASSLADCITSCDRYVPPEDDPIYGGQGCVAVTFTDEIVSGANCFRKYGVQQVVYGTSPFDSAKLANYSLSPSLSVSVVSTNAEATGQPTGTGAAEGTSTSTSATPTYTSYEPVTPCPIANNTYYMYPDGYNIVYYIQCGITYLYNDLPSLVTDSFEGCIAACDSWVPNTGYGVSYNQPCVAVSYTTYDPNDPAFDNCYRHYAVSETRNGGDPYGNGAVRVGNLASSQSVSTGTIASTMAGGNTATTAAGGGTTTAGQSTSTTATAQSVGGSGAGSSSASGGVGASSTSSTSSTSNTSSTSSTSSTSGTSSTGTGGASSSSAGAGSGTGSATATTGATASTVSALPCPCPSENGQTYTDSNNISYQIECDTEILYTDEPGSYFAPSLEDCLESCDAYVPATGAGDSGNQPCVGVRYAGNAPAGNNCFRMQPGYTTQATNPIDGICAAILVNTTAMSRKFAEADTPKLS